MKDEKLYEIVYKYEDEDNAWVVIGPYRNKESAELALEKEKLSDPSIKYILREEPWYDEEDMEYLIDKDAMNEVLPFMIED